MNNEEIDLKLHLLQVQIEELSSSINAPAPIQPDIDSEQLSHADMDENSSILDETDTHAIAAATQPYKFGMTSQRNGNWRKRCSCTDPNPCTTKNHGQSWITIKNRLSAFDVRVTLRNGKLTWAEWRKFSSTRHAGQWYILSGQDSGSYIYNITIVVTGRSILEGTFVFEFYDKGTNNLRATWKQIPHFGGGWGYDWFHCGHDFILTLSNP